MASAAFALVDVEVLLRALQQAPSEGIGSLTDAGFIRVPGLPTPNQVLLDWASRAGGRYGEWGRRVRGLSRVF